MSGKPANTRRKKRPISWQLQTSKAQFSEVFRRARSEGPQYVTRAGKEAVVIVPAEEFVAFVARRRQPNSLIEFVLRSQPVIAGLNFEREPDYGRDIELGADSCC